MAEDKAGEEKEEIPIRGLFTLTGHQGIVNEAVYVHRENCIISVADDKTIKVWDKDDDSGSWKCTLTRPTNSKPTAVTWDSRDELILVGLANGYVQFWELQKQHLELKLVNQIDAHTNAVTTIVYDPTHNFVISGGKDKKVRIYEKDSHVLRGGRVGNSVVSSIVYEAKTRRMFVGGFDSRVQILAYSENDPIPMKIQTLDGHKGSIRSLAYDKRKKYLFSGSFDKTVCIWDIGTPGKENSVRLAGRLVGHLGKIKGLAWDPFARRVYSTGDDKCVRIWEAHTGKSIINFQAHSDWVLGCQFVPQSGFLLTWSKDKTIKAWKIAEPVSDEKIREYE